MGRTADLARISAALRKVLPELRATYGVESLAVFGSVARGEGDTASDVDLLVRFDAEPPGFLGFFAWNAACRKSLHPPSTW